MEFFFSAEWRDGNFFIPANQTYRRELLAQMRAALESPRASDPAAAKSVAVIGARVAALAVYDFIL